jgi:hypothetical protein
LIDDIAGAGGSTSSNGGGGTATFSYKNTVAITQVGGGKGSGSIRKENEKCYPLFIGGASL